MNNGDALLTKEQAAAQLQISLRTLDRLSKAGKINRIKCGRHIRFTTDDLTQLKKETTTHLKNESKN